MKKSGNATQLLVLSFQAICRPIGSTLPCLASSSLISGPMSWAYFAYRCGPPEPLKPKMSCPEPAATSAAARAGSSRCGMWSTETSTLFCLPQSLANASIHLSYSGMKWLHRMIFSVLAWPQAVETNGADNAGARPAAPAMTLDVLRKSRRVTERFRLCPPDVIVDLLAGAVGGFVDSTPEAGERFQAWAQAGEVPAWIVAGSRRWETDYVTRCANARRHRPSIWAMSMPAVLSRMCAPHFTAGLVRRVLPIRRPHYGYSQSAGQPAKLSHRRPETGCSNAEAAAFRRAVRATHDEDVSACGERNHAPQMERAVAEMKSEPLLASSFSSRR